MSAIRPLSVLSVLTLAATPIQAQTTYEADAGQLRGFGSQVVIGPGEILVGESGNVFRPGMVYVYRKNDAGQWAETQVLTDAAGRSADRFGGRLALDGPTLLASVTPRGEEPASVAIFRRDDSGAWNSAGRLPHVVAEGERFGAALALSGDLAFVGAPEREKGSGAVYVYRHTGVGWAEDAVLRLEDGDGAKFGSALTLSGDHLLLGAPGAEKGAGLVADFQRAEGVWTQNGVLPAKVSDEKAKDTDKKVPVGTVLASRGDKVYVGVPRLNGGNGGVVVFRLDRESGEWTEENTLLPFEGVSHPARRGSPRFGASLSVRGDALWIGAPGSGAVYSYAWDEEGMTGVVKLTPGVKSTGSSFGAAVATLGDVGVVGATGMRHRMGGATVFERTDGTWSAVSLVTSEPESLDPIVGNQARCTGGAINRWSCAGVELESFLPVSAIGGEPGVMLNDMWGWYDEQTKREYAIVGRSNGTSFIDVTDPLHPRYVGNLPMTEGAHESVWRDMKVYHDHAFIVSDGAGPHGMQVFDLTRLRNVEAPATFDADFLYDDFASAHNIVMDESTGFAYVVGASSGGETCGGGLHMIDVRDPKQPKFAGCFSDGVTGRRGTGYTHDAQCVTYHGPDVDYQGHEICFGANETALSFADVTDKEHPVSITTVSYPNVAYAHQGWLTDDQSVFFSDDEGDEGQGLVDHTRTLVWDVADLDDPVLMTEYFGPTTETDHNLYVRGHLMYESNYGAGLRIIDISDPMHLKEIGYFDTDPDLGCCVSWSNYPFFRSGAIGVTGGTGGFFMVRKQPALVP